MKYIYALLISLFLPTVVFAQSVPVSWLRNTASGFLTPLNINDSVGIGTSTPYSKLSIQYGTIFANTLSPILTLGGTHAAASGGTSIDFTVNGNTNSMSRIGSVISGTSGELALYTTTQYSTVSPTEKLRITGSGNVGIGTSTPQRALSIYKSSSPVLQLTDSTAGESLNDGFLLTQSGLSTYLENTEAGPMYFRTSAANRMVIGANGNVGVGTTTPWTRLAVTGSTTIAGGPLIVLGSANTPISADTDWYRQFGIFRKDINDYSFMTLENRNGGSNASVDLLWNNDRTTSLSYYADLGFNSNAFNNPAFGNLNVANAWYGYNTDGPILWATATTSTAGYLDFITGGYSSSRMRITSTGNVGIGTTTPVRTLDVYGNGSFSSLAGDNSLQFGNSSGVSFIQAANVQNNSVKNLALQVSGGNVGIGTTTPAGNLEVLGSTGIYSRNSSGGRIVFDDSNVASASTPMTYITGADGSLQFGRANRAASGLTTGSAESLRITSTGNVGVGTTTPVANFQATTATASATTTIELGRANQGKGTCIKLYDEIGTAYYLKVATGGTLTLSATACASVAGF